MAHDRSLAATLAFGVAALAVHLVLGVAIGPGYAIPTSIVGAIAAAIALRGPVGDALARRLQGGAATELPPETVLGELDELRARIMELEERVDFSERLLAQRDTGGTAKDQGGTAGGARLAPGSPPR